jgi:hypothetical protein
MRRIGLRKCPYCGEDEIYLSRWKTWREALCSFFLLRVVRCHSCMRRHYRPFFLSPVPAWSVKRPVGSTAMTNDGSIWHRLGRKRILRQNIFVTTRNLASARPVESGQ